MAKACAHYLADFSQPLGPLLGCAHYDRLEVSAVEVFQAAETEDAILPEVFQWVAKELQLYLARSV